VSPRVLLFLIADTGGGHRASAKAVARHLVSSHPGQYEIHIVDPFAQAAPTLLGRTTGLYGPITQHARWLWGGLYHVTNSRAAVTLLRRSALRFVEPGITRLVKQLEPAAVVSFHPLLNHIAAQAAHTTGPRAIPIVTVITDLVDVHAAWACRDVDAVVTPSPRAFERCRRAGIPPSRCHQVGLAVDQSFRAALPTPVERRALRERLGLLPEAFLVLVCGGADGSGGIARQARALAAAPLDIELSVICGRNRRVLDELQGLKDHGGRQVLVHGFVTNMADWMRAADVVVTKAGPGTIAEALCSGVPLLLTWYLPGQERGNVEWVVDIGAGRYVPRSAQLVDAVAELSVPGSRALERMREAVREAARPEATAEIAKIVVDLATREAGASTAGNPVSVTG
jgi:1,2-diacylglycerol 3-beta-galactosyltransferase